MGIPNNFRICQDVETDLLFRYDSNWPKWEHSCRNINRRTEPQNRWVSPTTDDFQRVALRFAFYPSWHNCSQNFTFIVLNDVVLFPTRWAWRGVRWGRQLQGHKGIQLIEVIDAFVSHCTQVQIGSITSHCSRKEPPPLPRRQGREDQLGTRKGRK